VEIVYKGQKKQGKYQQLFALRKSVSRCDSMVRQQSVPTLSSSVGNPLSKKEFGQTYTTITREVA